MLAVAPAREATASPPTLIKLDLHALQQHYGRPAIGPVPPFRRQVGGGHGMLSRSRRRSRGDEVLGAKSGAAHHLDTRPDVDGAGHKAPAGLGRTDSYTTVVVEEARSLSPEEALGGCGEWDCAQDDAGGSAWSRTTDGEGGGGPGTYTEFRQPGAHRRPTPLPTPPLSGDGGLDGQLGKRCPYSNLFPLDEDDVPVYRGDYGMALLGDLLREERVEAREPRGEPRQRMTRRAVAAKPTRTLAVCPLTATPLPSATTTPTASTYCDFAPGPVVTTAPARPTAHLAYISYHAFIHTSSFRLFASPAADPGAPSPASPPRIHGMLQLLPVPSPASDPAPLLLLLRKRWDGDLLRKRVLEYGMVRAGKIDRLRPWKSKEPAVARRGTRGAAAERWIACTREDLVWEGDEGWAEEDKEVETEADSFATHQYGRERGRSSVVKPCGRARGVTFMEWTV